MALYRDVVSHARLVGIRVILPTARAVTSLGHIDRSMDAQFEAFHALYRDKVRFTESLWCGWRVHRVSAADPLYAKAIGLMAEEAVRHFGTDHLYMLESVTKGYPRRKVRFYAGSPPRLIRSALAAFPPAQSGNVVV